MAVFTDLVGKQFGRLTVKKLVGKTKNGMKLWECECSCGKTTIQPTNQLNGGHTKSCGCYSRDVARERFTTHGLRKTQIYKTWAGIKDRTNPNNHNCKDNYRKLGITMCDEWRDNFMAFYNWAIANGYKEEKLSNGRNKYEIDRIDTYGNYCPENCRWITQKEQMNNQTTNKFITYKDRTQTLAQWCDELDLDYGLVNQRLCSGWSVDRAFFESPDRKRYFEYKGQKLTKFDIARITGLTLSNVENRIFRNWDIERIMTQPARKVVRKNV